MYLIRKAEYIFKTTYSYTFVVSLIAVTVSYVIGVLRSIQCPPENYSRIIGQHGTCNDCKCKR